MSEIIRAAAKKWFYESFDCDLLEKMEKAGLIAQAEGFSISVMAELELEMESAFSAAQSELAALREEMAMWKGRTTNVCMKLTAAEQRNAALTELLSKAKIAVDDAAPVVERQPTGQWRISVNGDWFYGTKEQCERERAEYETTFTAEDYAEAGVVVPEQIWSSPPAPVAVVLPEPKQFPSHRCAGTEKLWQQAFSWNACLDKVKELNQ